LSTKKAKKVVAPKGPSLQQRIEKIHREIEALIAQHVDALAATTHGVPKGVLEQIVFSKARGCRCAEHDILCKRPS
jgi:translation initiation factor 2B subunit (eIF-2B alpha/beta/delta family)